MENSKESTKIKNYKLTTNKRSARVQNTRSMGKSVYFSMLAILP